MTTHCHLLSSVTSNVMWCGRFSYKIDPDFR